MSAQKQCPKCGEKNPAEAVMCWACYTSLTGGGPAALAGAGVGGGTVGGATPIADTIEKKSIDPKQLAIIGVGLLIALGFGVKTMMGGGETEDTALPGGGDVPPIKTHENAVPPVAITPGSGPEGPAAPGQPAPDAIKQQTTTQYTMLTPPNPRFAGATAVVLPATQTPLTPDQGKALAAVVYQRLVRIKKFSPVEIFVFSDEKAARVLANYQAQRRGAPLTPSDYTQAELAPAWKSVIVRQRSDTKKTTYSYPQVSPNTFWAND